MRWTGCRAVLAAASCLLRWLLPPRACYWLLPPRACRAGCCRLLPAAGRCSLARGKRQAV